MQNSDQSNVLNKLFPNVSDINYGVILIGTYFIFTFGSIQGLFPIINKLHLPYILSILSLLYAAFLVLNKRASFKDKITIKYMIICFYMMIYAFFYTIDNIMEINLLKLFIVYAAQYIIITTSIKKPSSFILLIDIWLLSILFTCYNGIYQGGLVWGSQWFNDENQLALVAATALPFAFVLFRESHSKLKKIFYIIVMLACVAVAVAAGNVSRGGVLAMSVVALFCWLLYPNKLRNFIWISVAIIIVFMYAPPRFFTQMDTLKEGDKVGTAGDRVYLWSVAMNMFKDHPLIGVGPQNYPEYFDRYKMTVNSPYAEIYSDRIYKRVAHSTIVTWLAEMGIVGCIILISLQISIYKNWKKITAIRKKNNKNERDKNYNFYFNMAHACVISQVAFWFAAMFITVTEYPFYWCLIPFNVAWNYIALEYLKRENTTPEPDISSV